MGSGNWIIDNLNSALETWNGKLDGNLAAHHHHHRRISRAAGSGMSSSVSTARFKAVGYALLVLFFVMGVVKTCGSFAEMKKPELAFKCFIRFVLAQAAVTWGMELMTGAFPGSSGHGDNDHRLVRPDGHVGHGTAG